jgi:hypothetical protein
LLHPASSPNRIVCGQPVGFRPTASAPQGGTLSSTHVHKLCSFEVAHTI